MAASAAPTTLSPPSLPEGDGHDAPNWVLLDILGYMITTMGDTNATLAEGLMSTGERIQVSLYTARPPQVSHFCVFCPDLGPAGFVVHPQVVSADSDLILFRVAVCPQVRFTPRSCDYFLYRAHPRTPSLHLLPHPYPNCNNFRDQEVALLSFGGGGGGGGGDDEYEYAVAALVRRYPTTEDVTPETKQFNLYLYRSSKPEEEWTSKVLSVADPLREEVCPVNCAPYHDTTKVIVLGRRALGLVGWVDLWRGILVCNVLEVNPELVDIPLPLPARGNRRLYHKCRPYIIRDITVNLLKDSIKYIEVECSPRKVTDSCVHQKQWKATTWSLQIPIVPSEVWHDDCTFDVAELTVDPMLSGLLPDNPPAEAALPSHHIGFPTMSMDDDVVYLLYKAYSTGQTNVVIAIDMRKKILQRFAKLVTGKDFILTRYCTSEISKYLCKDEDAPRATRRQMEPCGSKGHKEQNDLLSGSSRCHRRSWRVYGRS